jgi:DNA invertase Pin-like site-specific DNA recombinase
MTEQSKITDSHLARLAVVYLRQSSAAQVENNRESTQRQYALAHRARELGWPEGSVSVVDADLGLSGSGVVARSGFAQITADVALGRVGLVLGLEVSRLARNNADWHRLIELAGLTDTLIGDADGIYHPALFNDRLLLGLKGAMSEAELHVLRARLDGGIRNKAARGELRRGLPVGYVWGEAEGEVLLHPDEAVVHAVRTVLARFAEMGSARRVWKWFRDGGSRRHPLERARIQCDIRRPELPGLRGRLCLWQNTPRDSPGREGHVPQACAASDARAMAGPHPGPSRGIHRLADLRIQSAAHGRERTSESA